MSVLYILLWVTAAISIISFICLAIMMTVRSTSSAARGRRETAALTVVLISTALALIGCAIYVLARP